jgi:hypothetical protein
MPVQIIDLYVFTKFSTMLKNNELSIKRIGQILKKQ